MELAVQYTMAKQDAGGMEADTTPLYRSASASRSAWASTPQASPAAAAIAAAGAHAMGPCTHVHGSVQTPVLLLPHGAAGAHAAQAQAASSQPAPASAAAGASASTAAAAGYETDASSEDGWGFDTDSMDDCADGEQGLPSDGPVVLDGPMQGPHAAGANRAAQAAPAPAGVRGHSSGHSSGRHALQAAYNLHVASVGLPDGHPHHTKRPMGHKRRPAKDLTLRFHGLTVAVPMPRESRSTDAVPPHSFPMWQPVEGLRYAYLYCTDKLRYRRQALPAEDTEAGMEGERPEGRASAHAVDGRGRRLLLSNVSGGGGPWVIMQSAAILSHSVHMQCAVAWAAWAVAWAGVDASRLPTYVIHGHAPGL